MEEMHYRHHRSSFGAFFLIFLGVAFLLQNFGVLNYNIWTVIFRLWPLLLILLGLRIALEHSPSGETLVSLIEFILLAIVLLWLLSPTNPEIANFFSRNLPNLPKPTDLGYSY